MKKDYLAIAFLLLLTGSYLDCVRGPLLPVLCSSLSINYEQASWVFISGHLSAILLITFMVYGLRRFGERKLAILTCCGGVVVSFGVFFVRDFITLIIFALIVGTLVAMISSLGNILTIWGTLPEFRARMLSGLHTMFGLGAVLAPAISGYLLSLKFHWHWVVVWVAAPFTLLGIAVARRLPQKMQPEQAEPERLTASKSIGFTQLFMILAFCSYVAAEVLTSMWMVPFLVESADLTVPMASNYLALFFGVLFLTRFLCFLRMQPELELPTLILCLILSAFGMAVGHRGYLFGFAISGVMGPFVPLVFSHISRSYPKQWRTLTMTVVIATQLTLALMHLSVGKLATSVGLRVAYRIPAVLMLGALFCLLISLGMEKKHRPVVQTS